MDYQPVRISKVQATVIKDIARLGLGGTVLTYSKGHMVYLSGLFMGAGFLLGFSLAMALNS